MIDALSLCSALRGLPGIHGRGDRQASRRSLTTPHAHCVCLYANCVIHGGGSEGNVGATSCFPGLWVYQSCRLKLVRDGPQGQHMDVGNGLGPILAVCPDTRKDRQFCYPAAVLVLLDLNEKIGVCHRAGMVARSSTPRKDVILHSKTPCTEHGA